MRTHGYWQRRWTAIVLVALTVMLGAMAAPQPGQAEPRLLAQAPKASEVVPLRVASAFRKGVSSNWGFERFFLPLMEKMASEHFKVQNVGGPESFPPFELIEAVRSGAVALGNLPGAFYISRLPAADGMKLLEGTPSEIRARAGKWLEGIHRRIGVHWLGYTGACQHFALFTARPVTKPDLAGLMFRTTPIYRPMLEALGAQTMTTPPGEIFTALDRGMIQGYGWTEIGIFELGLHERTKYVILPAFYTVDTGPVMNAGYWDRLPQGHRDVLMKVMQEAERQACDFYRQAARDERQRWQKAGIQVVEFQGADREKYLKIINDSAWAELRRLAPNDAAELGRVLGR
jgi:TRAP-type mannitol/chloroaromatic compound transport system substrate-binding protein